MVFSLTFVNTKPFFFVVLVKEYDVTALRN